jgi:large subunit ribosomal protein LX
MSEVKVFRITGEIVKPNLRTTFRKEIRAVSPDNAKEKVYTDVGSRHRAKRHQIRIQKVEEVPAEEIENPLIKRMTIGEKPDVK